MKHTGGVFSGFHSVPLRLVVLPATSFLSATIGSQDLCVFPVVFRTLYNIL